MESSSWAILDYRLAAARRDAIALHQLLVVKRRRAVDLDCAFALAD
jgi:hypothetical protein